ncbi:MAG: toprim domain-containing protein, partial [Balneolales bacterium]
LGYNGQDCDLFGAVRFPKGGKYILLASGEEDTVAAFQMLRDDQLRRNKAAYQPVAVVGSTVGENCVKQIKNNYEYLTSFEKIIVCPDQDDAGLKAVEKILQVLPPDKTFVMQSPEKDANKCIDEKREVEFVRAFYSAIKHNPAGIVGSGDLMGKIVEYAKLPRLSLPPFLSSLQKMQAGGIPLGTIINFASGSGCVDKDTEFLTPTGWKKIDEYEQGDHVGQYEKDGKLRFVEPKEYIKQPAESLWSIQSKYGVDMCLSDEHRVIYRPRSINGKLKERTLKEVREIHDKVKYGFRGDFETTFDFSGPGINIPEGELRLQVAVMADGRIVREGKDNYCQMRFAKERKYDRLLAICKEYGLRHDDRGWKPHDRYLSGKIYEVIVWPKWADKNFDSKYYSCSKEQLEIILDELLYWDGYFGSMQYTTSDKQDADFIQF